jgi:hypothetical protein
MAELEMQPLQSDLDKAKAIIQKYADMGDANFIQLNKLVKGEIKKNPELRFVDVVNELTPDEKKIMMTVVEQLQGHKDYDHEMDYPFLESTLIYKSKGGKRRSKKRSNMRSKKNRRRRTTSRRQRSRARRSI